MAGYHLKEFPKGEVGELSKIYEEVEEVRDASEQNAELMVLLELSDLLGAVDLYLKKHHPSLSMEDLQKMSSITQRAFQSGARN